MSVRSRYAIAALLTAFVVVSLVRFFSGEPSIERFFRVLFLILVFTLPKGALLRFMGGKRTKRSALVATAASELPDLGFPLAQLGVPWPALTASFFISTYIEWLALIVMRTAPVSGSFIMALYMNIFTHVLVAGFHLWPDSHLLSVTVVFVSFLVYIFPIFVKFVPNSAKTKHR